MNDQQRAAMTMALEALDCRYNDNKVYAAITALREALAQPQVEPVAFVNADYLQGLTLGHYGYAEIYTDESEGRIPLYTTPPSVEAAIEATKERCAKVCEEHAERHEESAQHEETADYANRCLVYGKHIRTCAAAIRSMK